MILFGFWPHKEEANRITCLACYNIHYSKSAITRTIQYPEKDIQRGIKPPDVRQPNRALPPPIYVTFIFGHGFSGLIESLAKGYVSP
jgi:hypothetical protein